jgi:hypothetical protein
MKAYAIGVIGRDDPATRGGSAPFRRGLFTESRGVAPALAAAGVSAYWAGFALGGRAR